ASRVCSFSLTAAFTVPVITPADMASLPLPCAQTVAGTSANVSTKHPYRRKALISIINPVSQLQAPPGFLTTGYVHSSTPFARPSATPLRAAPGLAANLRYNADNPAITSFDTSEYPCIRPY